MAKAKDSENMARAFRALAVESRVRIMQLLAERTLCVGALSNLLGISAGAVSQHLRVLRDAGLVDADRRGYFIHYRLVRGARARCRAALDTLFKPMKRGARCAARKRSVRGRKT
jgi:DNA-binding transcriptional ArsR family regulator